MNNSSTRFTLHELHFITITVVDWVDIFTRPLYKRIITDSLAYCQQSKGLRVFAWVLMSNHLHAIVDASGELSVADIVRDFKKYTSKRLLREIQTNPNESRREWMLNRFRYAGNNDKKITNYRLWQEGYHPEQIYTYGFYKQKLDYIHLNPVKAGMVRRPERYKYSSMAEYMLEMPGIIHSNAIKKYTSTFTEYEEFEKFHGARDVQVFADIKEEMMAKQKDAALLIAEEICEERNLMTLLQVFEESELQDSYISRLVKTLKISKKIAKKLCNTLMNELQNK